MTAIAGYSEKGTVWMGGDSAASDGQFIELRQDAKVFKKGQMLIGYTTSFRMGQIIQHNLKLPKDKRKDPMRYLIKDFVPKLIKAFEEHKYDEKGNNGGQFLIGYKGSLFKIEGDYQVGRTLDNYSACGCGEGYCLGAFSALEKDYLDPKHKVKRALQAAQKFSTGVRGPFTIINT